MLYIRRVVGVSMLPTLRPGTIVVAIKNKLRVGRIVIAEVGGREVIKRVTAISDNGITLQGDNLLHSTDSRLYGPVPQAAIKGVVVLPIRKRV